MLVVRNRFHILFIFWLCLILNGCGGNKVKYYSHDPDFHGRELTFNVPMVYVLTKGFENYFSKEASKYGKELFVSAEPEIFQQFYGEAIQIKSIPTDMKFVIKKSFLDIPYGFISIFNSEIFYLVLEDENKVESVISFTSIQLNSDFKL